MLDQAGEYFHDTYGGEMVNLFGYLWAMKLTDFRTPDEQRTDGRAEHATMTATSVILALQPQLVAQDCKAAPSHTEQSMKDLEQIAGLAGEDYRKLPRLADLATDDPADAAALSVNRRLQSQHEAWLQSRSR
ncbi:MAG: creatininase family protein [Bryobacterales bacterium]|nr:creatininase family protein [Bryobacterales bacterium]